MVGIRLYLKYMVTFTLVKRHLTSVSARPLYWIAALDGATNGVHIVLAASEGVHVLKVHASLIEIHIQVTNHHVMGHFSLS